MRMRNDVQTSNYTNISNDETECYRPRKTAYKMSGMQGEAVSINSQVKRSFPDKIRVIGTTLGVNA